MTLLVPYRDRADHLKEFVKELGSKHDIVIVEQCDDKPFNRGKLINAGYLETKPYLFVVNDIDMIGPHEAYKPLSHINQLCRSEIQRSSYLGGATMYDAYRFEQAGGYHNDYFHRAEDNEMMFTIKRKKIIVTFHDHPFIYLPHPRSGPEFIPELWQKAQLPRTKNMLKTCEYQLISKEIKEGYTLIRVLL